MEFQFEPSPASFAGIVDDAKAVMDDAKAAVVAKLDSAKAAVSGKLDSAKAAVSGAQNRGAELIYQGEKKADQLAGVLAWLPWVAGALAVLTVGGLALAVRRRPNPAQDRPAGRALSELVAGEPEPVRGFVADEWGRQSGIARRSWERAGKVARTPGVSGKVGAYARSVGETTGDVAETYYRDAPRIIPSLFAMVGLR